MNRLERLINLVAALLDANRPLSAEDLRQRVPGYAADKATFRRAFERDKETLRDMGVPVVTEVIDPAEPGGLGYRILKEDYYLADPGLAADELAALHLAASAVHLEGADGVGALWKLGGEVAERGPSGLPSGGQGPSGLRSGGQGPSGPLSGGQGPTTPMAALPDEAHLSVLFSAISERRRVAFGYRGKARRIEPHRLSFRNGHWYLAGRDIDVDDDRLFRLDRIETGVSLGDAAAAFERGPVDATPATSPWETGGDEAVTARLLVDADQAAWATGHLGADAVEERRPDGAVVVAVRVTNRDAFRSFVLGFLDHAEILGPEDLRADIVVWLEAFCPA